MGDAIVDDLARLLGERKVVPAHILEQGWRVENSKCRRVRTPR